MKSLFTKKQREELAFAFAEARVLDRNNNKLGGMPRDRDSTNLEIEISRLMKSREDAFYKRVFEIENRKLGRIITNNK